MTVSEFLSKPESHFVIVVISNLKAAKEYIKEYFPYQQDEITGIVTFQDLIAFQQDNLDVFDDNDITVRFCKELNKYVLYLNDNQDKVKQLTVTEVTRLHLDEYLFIIEVV